MAGASMNGIKARMKSVSSTMQITKAMELVATSKLRRAKERAESSRPFHKMIGDAIDSIEASSEVKDSIWSKPSDGNRPLYIVIAGDRGLAGGYNSNVFRLTASLVKTDEALYLPIGKKSIEHYTHRKKALYDSEPLFAADTSVGDALEIARRVCADFKEGKFDSVILVYTRFASMISQVPTYKQLLPLDRESGEKKNIPDPIYAGDPEEILDKIVPEYVGGVLNSALCEAVASESAARRTAMNAANKNASEMIDTLMLIYNRARQAVITQEITEIVSGSEAL